MYCGKPNIEGSLFCDRCNEPLVEINDETKPKAKAPLVLFEENKMAFEAPEAVIIQVKGEQDARFTVDMPHAPIILGRSDTQDHFEADIELSAYNAAELGVSRRHAMLAWDENGVTVEDLGSINGTLLNGHRLEPHYQRVVGDGDEISLGKLTLQVYFSKSA
jgi:hypothetical protein